MRRLRIGLFTADFFPALGGIGMVALELYRGLEGDAEFELEVFSPAHNDLPNHHRLTAVHSRLWLPLSFSLTANVLLEHLIRRHSLDALHFMGSSGGVQLLRKPSKPTLLTLHNSYHYLYRKQPGLVFLGMREAERSSLRNSSRITCVSHGVRAELPESARPGVQVIQNGIDTRLFHGRDSKKRRNFLFPGRLVRRKGVFDLLEAFARAEVGGFELHFVGGGPQSEILAAAQRLGVADRVRLLGQVPREQMPMLYSQAHAVVLPSWSEGFPLCVTEAMACGALFIGTAIPGIVEQVDEGVTGFLCPPRMPDLLARCLTRAATLEPAQLASMRDCAAQAAGAHSIDRMVEQYRASYQAILRS